jgi:hypothetical protein
MNQMKRRIRIYSHNPHSQSAAKISEKIPECLRIRHTNSKYVSRETDIIINWGASEFPFECNVYGSSDVVSIQKDGNAGYVINPLHAVSKAIDKRKTFRILYDWGINVPKFTSDLLTVRGWLSKGYTVVGRQLSRASGSKGIHLMKPEDYIDATGGVLPQYPLYTLYRKKMDEYRIHVFCGQVIDFQQKKRSVSDERWQGDNQIRSFDRGWIYTRENVVPPRQVTKAALKAVRRLGLHFGAVDVGFSHKTEQATIYEVNTAPGLHGATLDSYTNKFMEFIL